MCLYPQYPSRNILSFFLFLSRVPVPSVSPFIPLLFPFLFFFLISFFLSYTPVTFIRKLSINVLLPHMSTLHMIFHPLSISHILAFFSFLSSFPYSSYFSPSPTLLSLFFTFSCHLFLLSPPLTSSFPFSSIFPFLFFFLISFFYSYTLVSFIRQVPSPSTVYPCPCIQSIVHLSYPCLFLFFILISLFFVIFSISYCSFYLFYIILSCFSSFPFIFPILVHISFFILFSDLFHILVIFGSFLALPLRLP
jgi:hypothetical protein